MPPPPPTDPSSATTEEPSRAAPRRESAESRCGAMAGWSLGSIVVMVVIAFLVVAWPVSYWRAAHASVRHVWVEAPGGEASTPSEPSMRIDPPAGFRSAWVDVDRGRVRVGVEVLATTRMGLMGWGPIRPGWHCNSGTRRATERMMGATSYYNSWRFWRAGPFEMEFRQGAPSRGIVSVPLWLPAIVGLVLIRRASSRRTRRRREWLGRCVSCGYDRAGLSQASPCPECGVAPRTRTEEGD